MGNDDVIEFNGKRYDAFTGKVLGKSHSEVAEPLAAPRARKGSIDGVVRKAAQPHHPVGHHAKPIHPRPTPSHAGRHRPQAAKTLMRRTVHKPSATMKPHIKPQTPAEVMARPVSAVAVKHSVQHVDPLREQRAKHTPKSQAVKRFTHAAPGQPAPVFEIAPPQTPLPPPVSPTKPAHHTKHDIFEAAIAHATSHEQPPVKHHKRSRRRKVVGSAAAIAVLFLLGGFIAYLNRAAIEVEVASFQAGFTAQLPTHQPTGYELTNIQNRHGQVVLQYHSGNRNYQITQQPTDWNSQTLGDQIIAGAGSQTIQAKGRTIYIYDDIASWVSGGVRYDITGNAALDQNEIAAIAGSM